MADVNSFMALCKLLLATTALRGMAFQSLQSSFTATNSLDHLGTQQGRQDNLHLR